MASNSASNAHPLSFVFLLTFLHSLLVDGKWLAEKNCSVDPFSMAFGNVTILNDPDLPGAHRGVQMFVGSEQKRLSVNLATTINNTFFPDGPSVCNTSLPNARQCIFWRGGLFDRKGSDTWEADDGVTPYNASASNQGFDSLHSSVYNGEDPLSQFPRGFDQVILGNEVGGSMMNAFPLTIINNASFPFSNGMLGLSSDSRFLDAAVAANITPSHSWALDYGAVGEAGEFSVGGYQPSKAGAPFQNFSIMADPDIPCPLQVNVSSIKLGGKELTTKMFTACLEMAVWYLAMPLEVQKNFNSTVLSDNKGLKWYTDANDVWESFVYNNTHGSGLPTESMTVVLDGGLSIEIPSEELFHPYRAFIPTGGWAYVNGTTQARVGTNGYPAGQEPMVQFGGPFLSQLYLAVNYETSKFSLAPIKRTDKTAAGTSKKLEMLGCEDVTSATLLPDPKPQPNMGAVAGGVVGGVAGLALVLGAGYFVFRRRRNKARMNIVDNGGREHHKDMYGNESPPDYDHKDPINNGVTSQNEIYEVSAQRRSEICEIDGGPYYSPSDNASTKEVHVAQAKQLGETVG